jgi:uncharacterized protein with HEPN domain
MRDSIVTYKQRLEQNLNEAEIHLKRIDNAFEELTLKYDLPMNDEDFKKLLVNRQDLAFADQLIYRFSKAQDCMGGKLFKLFILFQGENADRPFLDILNSLEKLNILNVDEWFELREIRNEIAHNYDDNTETALNIINSVYMHKQQLQNILNAIRTLENRF